MQIVALLQTYNEQRFIERCIGHLNEQGVSVYLVDNESTDDTLAIAERHVGKGVIGVETLAREGNFSLHTQLRRKQELAGELDADWFIHQDADELRVSSERGRTLAQTLGALDEAGYNAANFLEFTFMPTRERPDHEGGDFAATMRSYYCYVGKFPHRLNAWKRQDGPVELARQGGHRIRFPGLRMAPLSLYSRHYIFLSPEHAALKFGPGRYAGEDLKAGWFNWRSRFDPSMIQLPSERELLTYEADHLLDASNPRTHHIAAQWTKAGGARQPPLKRAVARGRRAARRLTD